MLTLLPLFVIVASCQAPAGPPRDRAAAAPGTAAISGTVVSDEPEAHAVRRARVTLRGADGTTAETITDDAGRFEFEGLGPGRYVIAAVKAGWLPATYGARRPLRPGNPMPLGPGEHARIAIRLFRGSVITGEVVDPHGLPAAGATVRAMRYSMRRGERVFDFTGPPAVADDRGAYRIYGLPPGDYVIGASWRPAYFGGAESELRLTSDIDVRSAPVTLSNTAPAVPDRAVALASTFYPGTTVPAQASIVTVAGGEERREVDFTLQIVPASRLEGTVIAPDGRPLPAGVRVSLMSIDAVSFQDRGVDVFRETGVRTDGSFAFVDVAPGQYTVFARTSLQGGGAGSIVWASTDVSVEGDSLSGLDLAMTPGTRLSGRVRFEGEARPVDARSVRVALVPEQTHGLVTVTPVTAAVDGDGRFTVEGVTPGQYRLTASLPGLGRPDGWHLRSAVALGVETLDVPVTIPPGQDVTDAVIAFSDRMADLTGRLQDPRGAPANQHTVILFPRDAALWTPQSRRIQAAQPSTDGAFAFGALAPGDYLLTVVDDAEPGEWFDPAFLQRLAAGAMPIAIAAGERKVQNVQVGGL